MTTYLNNLESADNIVIYGFGKVGRQVLEDVKQLRNKNIIILDQCIIDGTYEYDTYTVDTFDWSNVENDFFIVSSIDYCKELTDNLLKFGVDERRIVYPYDVMRSMVAYYKNIYNKRTPRNELKVISCITEHCNLNCVGCDHFSPLSEKWFMDISEFDRDFKRLSEIAGNRVSLIHIEGGEPLLHKNINEFLVLARKYFSDNSTEIRLFTNGLLLEKMDSFFWDNCRNNNIVIMVTKYPVNLNYEKIERIANDNYVRIEFANVDVKTMYKRCLDIDGKQNKYDSFHKCSFSNGKCAQLKNGKLFQCTMLANIHIFNSYFCKCLEINKKDYIDIYSNISIDDIYDFLCNPSSGCKYCRVDEWKTGLEWGISKREISEWV